MSEKTTALERSVEVAMKAGLDSYQTSCVEEQIKSAEEAARAEGMDIGARNSQESFKSMMEEEFQRGQREMRENLVRIMMNHPCESGDDVIEVLADIIEKGNAFSIEESK